MLFVCALVRNEKMTYRSESYARFKDPVFVMLPAKCQLQRQADGSPSKQSLRRCYVKCLTANLNGCWSRSPLNVQGRCCGSVPLYLSTACQATRNPWHCSMDPVTLRIEKVPHTNFIPVSLFWFPLVPF